MNELHLQLCASPEWAEYVRGDLIPWVLAGRDLGEDVLELGPGPGLTTDVLREVVPRLTVLEIDEGLASELRARLAALGVEVKTGDARRTEFDGETFSAVTCFTMLHHVPAAEAQDEIFREVLRILRPGGLFIGTDSVDSPELRELHVDDTFVPVDPATLPNRLARAGFHQVSVSTAHSRVRFTARRPA